MNQYGLHEDSENLQYWLKLLKSPHWTRAASEETIDSIFKCALQLEGMSLQRETGSAVDEYLAKNYNFNIKAFVDEIMQNVLQNHHIDEKLTLYAIEKYTTIYSKSDFSKLLDKIFSEVELRKQIFNLLEQSPDEKIDFNKLNNFLCDLLNSSDFRFQLLSSFKNKTSLLLQAIKHSLTFNKEAIIEEMIACLESQTDLRLWFLIMKDENIDIVLELCAQHQNFLNAVLKFFDKFAHEIESNYDEDLNVIYSHVNLDFEDFIRILQLFLNKKSVKKAVYEYLEGKTLTEKNYCFWTDVKACL